LTYPLLRFRRPLVVSPLRLALAALLFGVLVPRIAAAVQGAELYHTKTYRYGRFEARVRYAPGEGVVSSFFLWKDRPGNTGPWNELDFEKINSDCRMQTNIWTGTGTQSAVITTPSPNICNDYHTYTIEWTPDYIAWFIDGTQLRRVTGAPVTEYTQNATPGMAIHFNIWQGDSSFGGTLNTSTLPVYQYISWVQYSSYANGAFQMQWREEFTGSTMPTDWLEGNWLAPLNHSMHNIANANYVNGIAVLALTNDNATGYTGTPPADPGSGGTSGTGGTGGSSAGGTTGSAGRGGTTGSAGRGGTTGGGGTGGGASAGTGGTSSSGNGGNSAGGTAGTGVGGTTAGAAGTGAGGVTAGTAGDGGPGSGGAIGTGGTSTTGAAGTGQNPIGTGGTAVAGQAGSTGQTGGDGGCSCDVGSAGGGRSITALLLALALAARRRPRRRD
jgi:endo-1,3-1,4-beta-glycanase ExoK